MTAYDCPSACPGAPQDWTAFKEAFKKKQTEIEDDEDATADTNANTNANQKKVA